MNQLFPTITGAHWRAALARGRAERNAVQDQIRAALTRQKLRGDAAPRETLGLSGSQGDNRAAR